MSIKKRAVVVCLLLYLNSHGRSMASNKNRSVSLQTRKRCDVHVDTRPKHHMRVKQQYPFWEYYRKPHYYDYATYDDVGFEHKVYI